MSLPSCDGHVVLLALAPVLPTPKPRTSPSTRPITNEHDVARPRLAADLVFLHRRVVDDEADLLLGDAAAGAPTRTDWPRAGRGRVPSAAHCAGAAARRRCSAGAGTRHAAAANGAPARWPARRGWPRQPALPGPQGRGRRASRRPRRGRSAGADRRHRSADLTRRHRAAEASLQVLDITWFVRRCCHSSALLGERWNAAANARETSATRVRCGFR